MEQEKKKSPKEKKFYVSTVEFDKEVRLFHETGKWTPFLIDAIRNMANGLAHRYNFIRYSWREDMISNAIVNMTHALVNKKYDTTKNFSAFGYFNAIAWNACLEVIRKETKNKQTIRDYRERVYQDLLSEHLDDEHVIYVKASLDYIVTEKEKDKTNESTKAANKEKYAKPKKTKSIPVDEAA